MKLAIGVYQLRASWSADRSTDFNAACRFSSVTSIVAARGYDNGPGRVCQREGDARHADDA